MMATAIETASGRLDVPPAQAQVGDVLLTRISRGGRVAPFRVPAKVTSVRVLDVAVNLGVDLPDLDLKAIGFDRGEVVTVLRAPGSPSGGARP